MFEYFQSVSDAAVTTMSENEKLKHALVKIVLPAVVICAASGFINGSVQAYIKTKKEQNTSK